MRVKRSERRDAQRRRINKNGKGKAIPLQAWRGPEGSKRLRLPDFETIGICKW